MEPETTIRTGRHRKAIRVGKPKNTTKKMKSFKIISLFILVLTIFTTSCKKDETKVFSKSEILTAHPWKKVSFTANAVSYLADFEKDDIITFSTNGTITLNPGLIKSDNNDVGLSGTWSLSDDGLSLTINESEDGIHFSEFTVKVTELSLSKLATSNEYDDKQGHWIDITIYAPI